jgi:AcrR family transcriptional regulator
MGVAERKEREKQEMRETILAAATQMFLEEGYDKTSIRAIADRIEYSPGTIYLYFKDKDELFYAIHAQGFVIMLGKMEKLKKIAHPLARLKELGKIYIQFALDNPEYYDLMFIMRGPMKALEIMDGSGMECWSYGESTHEFLKQTIQECIDQNLVTITDVQVGAMTMWSLVHGMVSLHIRQRLSIMNEDEKTLKKLLFKGLDQMVDAITK